MKLNEYYPDSHPDIFTNIADAYTQIGVEIPEWLDSPVKKASLSGLYIYGHSGYKTISPLLEKVLLNSGNVLNAAHLVVAAYAVIRFNDKWDRLYNNVVRAAYQAIENYDLNELETPDITRTKREEVDKMTLRTVSTDLTTTSNGGSNAKAYGFNNGSGSPVSSSDSDATSRVIGTPANNQVNESVSSNPDHNYITDTEEGTRTLRRHGNIGVTTTQQMLESEIKLREWEFFQSVFADLDSINALKIYEI